jgi:hypothetical protein
MREFDPDNPMMRREMHPDDRPAGFGTVALLAGLAIAVVVGFMVWNMGDRSDTATNTAPGTTTGSSTTSPPSPATPPGKDSSTTR